MSVPLRSYSAPSHHLEECLKKELKLERMTMEEVPIVSGFEVSYTGSRATLRRQYKDEMLVPTLSQHDNYYYCVLVSSLIFFLLSLSYSHFSFAITIVLKWRWMQTTPWKC